MSYSPDISVIIVNWNARSLLLDCLASLEAGLAGLKAEIIVVDNDSSDDSAAAVAAAFPRVQLIASPTNLGFAAGNNRGAAAASGRHLLLLNPDTVVPPNTAAALVQFADSQPDLGALGPQLLSGDGRPQRSCWRGFPGLRMAFSDAFYLWKLPWLPFFNDAEYRPAELTTTRDVDHLLGACLLIPRAAWIEVGPMDEAYFLFLEETDWCRRAQQAGRRILFYPQQHIIHFGQHSSRQRPERNLVHGYRSYCHFYRQQQPNNRPGMALLKGIIALGAVVKLGLWQLRRRGARSDLPNRMSDGYRRVLRELASF